ncbi:MAG: hypothetical protein ABJC09_13950 [Terriglobia bacterium]
MNRFLSRILAGALFAALAFAAWHAGRQAWADLLFQDNTLNSVQRAVLLEKGNAEYRELLGEHLEGLGYDPTSEFISATKLSPRNARYWIRLSFFHEVQGKYQDAERELLEADRVDRKFDPPWALMNFYFRRNNSREFWRWTRRALEISYDDVSAIFRLALNMDSDWRATAAVLPSRSDVAAQFLVFLTNDGRANGTGPLALQVARTAQAKDVPALLAWCNHAMEKEMPAAVAVWNTLCARGLLHHKALAPAEGQLITNGDFSWTPAETGFDWRADPVEGVSAQFPGGSEGLEVTLSGGQPENCFLLWQPIPLAAGQHYTLEYQYKVSGSDRTSSVGVHWEIAPPAAGAILARSEDFQASSEWTTATFRFDSAGNNAARLMLRYIRPPGSVRWQGTLMVRELTSRISR